MNESEGREAELQELRDENARLKLESEQQRPESHGHRWRWALAIVLIILGGVLLFAAIPAMWAGRTVLDTNRYTETVAPLAANRDIQKSMAVLAVDRLFTQANIGTRVQDALPPKASFIAPQITAGLQSFSVQTAEKAFATSQFQTIWTEVNRRAHQRIIRPLVTGTGNNSAVSVQQGMVTLDISNVIAQVKSTLVARGIGIASSIPDNPAVGQVKLFQSSQLASLQTGLRALRALAIALPLLALAAFVIAVPLAPDRRRALFWVAVTSIVAMLALGAALALARDSLVSSPPPGVLSSAATAAFFDTLVRFLRNSIRTVAALGLVLLVASALAGPSPLAVRIRSAVSSGTGSLGLDLGRPAYWTERHRRALDAAIVVVATLVLLATNTPTPGLVAGLALAVLIGFVLVELIGHAHGAGESDYRHQPSA